MKKKKLFTILKILFLLSAAIALFCLISILAACTFPPPGHYKRIEDNIDKIRVGTQESAVDNKATAKASQQISKDTKAIAENIIKDAEKKKSWLAGRDDFEKWEKERAAVPGHTPAPEDKDPLGGWLPLIVLIGTLLTGGTVYAGKLGLSHLNSLQAAPSPSQHEGLLKTFSAFVDNMKGKS